MYNVRDSVTTGTLQVLETIHLYCCFLCRIILKSPGLSQCVTLEHQNTTPTHSLGASIMLTCLSSDSGTQTTPPQHSRAKDYWYISDIWDHLTQYPDRKDYRLIAILLVSVIAHLKTE